MTSSKTDEITEVQGKRIKRAVWVEELPSDPAVVIEFDDGTFMTIQEMHSTGWVCVGLPSKSPLEE